MWRELLDPVFGHPVLTAAFFLFYRHFLKGKDNGGLATGFCTALASLALDRFWTGHDDTFTSVVRDDAFRREMTAVHGRLLTRESLLSFHDQGRRGNANVETSFRRIESIFDSGGTRETAPILFFVPTGEVWDANYRDRLEDSHCIVPIRVVYPIGYDGSSLAGVRIECWDNNHPADPDCYVELRIENGKVLFQYTAAGSLKFDSADGITLTTATLGEFLLRDLSLPFGGPFGLTRFVLDYLLSPATLQVSDSDGRLTGRVGGQILSEIPDSHPVYLIPDAYLLPPSVGLTRRITGTETGTYEYGSLTPEGMSVTLAGVPTEAGAVDRMLINGDASRIRFVPGAGKSFDIGLGTTIAGRARGLAIEGVHATPTEDLDLRPALTCLWCGWRTGARISPWTSGWSVSISKTRTGRRWPATP